MSGTLFDLSALSFITRQSATALAEASRPTTIADARIKYRPLPRLAITNSAQFNHFVIAGGSLLRTLQVLGVDFRENPPPPDQMQRTITSFLDERTSLNSFRERVEASYDVRPRLTLRGGYRFTHRRAVLDTPSPITAAEESKLNRHTGIGGFSLRATNKLRLFTEFERGSADNVFTRISPYHVTRLRLHSTYQPLDKLRLSGQYLLTDSRNLNPLVDHVQRSRVFSIVSSGFPHDRFGLDLGYTRLDVSSFIDIIDPRTRQTGRSVYIADDNVVDNETANDANYR